MVGGGFWYLFSHLLKRLYVTDMGGGDNKERDGVHALGMISTGRRGRQTV